MVKTMNVSNVMVLVIALAATTSVFMLTEAREYTVGDELGWTIPPDGAATYASWAAKHSLDVNDFITFNFEVGESDLAIITKEDFDSCNTADPLFVFDEPGEFQFAESDTYYLTCTFAGHCSKGRKIALYIAPADSPSPAPCESQSQSQSDTVKQATAVKFVSKKQFSFKKLMFGTIKSL